jgi:hypothetical protein
VSSRPYRWSNFAQSAQHGSLDPDPQQAHHQRCHDQGRPVVEVEVRLPDQRAQHGVAQQRHIGAQHVEGAVDKVDDVQEAENHRQAEAQDGIEDAVVEPQHDLRHDGLKGQLHDQILRTGT